METQNQSPQSQQAPVLPDNMQDIKHSWEFQGFDDHSTNVLVLHPTSIQIQDSIFPKRFIEAALLLGAEAAGVFKITIPADLADSPPHQLPNSSSYNHKTANERYRSYRRQGLKATGFVRLHDGRRNAKTGRRAETPTGHAAAWARPAPQPDADHALVTATPSRLLDMWNQLRTPTSRLAAGTMRYIVDVPLETPQDRQRAGVPERSVIWPLAGNRLDEYAPIPGLCYPYKYEGTALAPFTWHVEDVGLLSLNHLFQGVKVWFCIPGPDRLAAEEVFRSAPMTATAAIPHHEQFMRHNATLDGHAALRRAGVRVVPVVQRAGEIVVTLPEAYHSGFSAGYTVCEAVNYADRPLKVGEERAWCTLACSPCPMNHFTFRRRSAEVEIGSSGVDGVAAAGEVVDGAELDGRKRARSGDDGVGGVIGQKRGRMGAEVAG
ncbi:hypothetical protein MCOR25_007865 [Pyricularia grisea]|uniref:JmjC domain-containing protein n=1 Tax=Pyricularia grisea TaxID=148305 RepID=A0A6P8AMD4_PYRGI|nr:uncharacterized protein PgNI_12452 [Pyricularia grisea]KAI6356770.1 hypothetical protein MCOR25_007865 [Pyricularia grisea]TLD03179.1 hypothetical protein PgNI_12452 [Pyricularia grisea]